MVYSIYCVICVLIDFDFDIYVELLSTNREEARSLFATSTDFELKRDKYYHTSTTAVCNVIFNVIKKRSQSPSSTVTSAKIKCIATAPPKHKAMKNNSTCPLQLNGDNNVNGSVSTHNILQSHIFVDNEQSATVSSSNAVDPVPVVRQPLINLESTKRTFQQLLMILENPTNRNKNRQILESNPQLVEGFFKYKQVNFFFLFSKFTIN